MSVTIDPTQPLDSSSPTLGAADIRTVTAELQEMFGGAGTGALTYTVPPFSTDVTTGLTAVPGDPTVALGIATKQYVDASAPGTVFVGVAGGTANAITTTLTPVPASAAAMNGKVIRLRIVTTNTGATTFNPNTLGIVAVVKPGPTTGSVPLTGGELVAGNWYDLTYDTGTGNYQIVNTVAPRIQVAYHATDQAVTSSTSLTNDNSLFFPIAANEAWTATINAYVTMSAAGGFDISWTVPSGATLVFGDSVTGAPTTTSGSRRIVLAGSSGTNSFFRLPINVINGSTPGTVQFQFSQDASDGTGTILKTGSMLVATKVN